MTIYTRTGDGGQTSLLKGGRIDKFALRVETYGTIDELNSWIGFALSQNPPEDAADRLRKLQNRVHILCSDIAAFYEQDACDEKIPRIEAGWDSELEREIDEMDRILPPLSNFINPGGCPSGASLHIARTVCRRAERLLHKLNYEEGGVNPQALKFGNRMSDYLFSLARYANFLAGTPESIWKYHP